MTTSLYFRGEAAEMAGAYGQETGKIVTYFTGLYGPPPEANLTVVETENGAPNGYAADGILFLAPRSISKQVNRACSRTRLRGSGGACCVSASTRDHLWLTNGAARYSELLYIEHTGGAAAFEGEFRDTYVEALTVDEPAADPGRAAGGLFARVLGADGGQGRGGLQHAALRDGRREASPS